MPITKKTADVVWRQARGSLAQRRAMQAFGHGEATPEQQKIVLQWILYDAAGTTDEVYVPGQSDAIHYLAGRRSVGLQIINLLTENPDAFRAKGETD